MTTRRGLRAQILAALFLAVVLAFAVLDLVIARIGEHARVAERLHAAEASAALLAEIASAPEFDLARFARNADALVGRGGVIGVEVVSRSGATFVRGRPYEGTTVESRSSDGVLARVYVSLDRGTLGRRQREFLFLYIALTAGGILLLVYATLTFLVVRPIERMRMASERLAGGRLDEPVEERGPRELEELARSFNRMASDLRHDREALVTRLAELEATTRGLREAQEQIVRSEKLASVGRLSAGVAHEIGNPLAAILGLVELVESGDLTPEESREFVARIRGETERIHGILRDLLDFSRQGNEVASDADATCEVVAVAREAATLVRPQRGFRSIEVVVHGDAPTYARCPEARLTQVLLNLLLNAADAIGERGRIDVRIGRLESSVRIEVDDDGPGIAPEVSQTLFEPFVTTKEVGSGTGLGLAVCHTIVERCGGRISAGGHEGRGARFTIELPYAEKSADA